MSKLELQRKTRERAAKIQRVVHGRDLLTWGLFFLAVAAVIVAWWLE